MNEQLFKLLSIAVFGKAPLRKSFNFLIQDFSAIERRLLTHYAMNCSKPSTVHEAEQTARGITAAWYRGTQEVHCPQMPKVNQIKFALLVGERMGLLKLL